ncbi:hypothetical protein ABMA10_12170 [Plantibacter sp. RU18]
MTPMFRGCYENPRPNRMAQCQTPRRIHGRSESFLPVPSPVSDSDFPKSVLDQSRGWAAASGLW